MKLTKPIRLSGNFVEATTDEVFSVEVLSVQCHHCNEVIGEGDERFGLCRHCNEDSGFCYDCENRDEKISELKSSNKVMLETLKELQVVFKMKDSFTQGPGTSMGSIMNDKLDNLITKAEGK